MNHYLQLKTIYPPQIETKPSPNLGMTIIIPSKEEPYLILSLMALKKCALPEKDVEVIVVINSSERDSDKVKKDNLNIFKQASDWAIEHSTTRLRFHILIFQEMKHKFAGVGLARKIGLDEATWRYEKFGITEGILVCFDADSRCQKNYLQAIESHFNKYPKTSACSIYFEHPLSGADFAPAVYDAIMKYELHLRYFVNAQRWIGFPFAYQTIGSSMAVRVTDYQKQGGMNRRKAGEDFYFLHKFIELGNFTELNTTCVIPSPRPSHRVPFGTGKAVDEMINGKTTYSTYSPQSFTDLKELFERVEMLYKIDATALDVFLSNLPPSVADYLRSISFEVKILEIKKHTSNFETFENRFFRWFNAFQLMKYVHFARDHYYPNVGIEMASKWMLEQYDCASDGTLKWMLEQFRELDRSGRMLDSITNKTLSLPSS